MKVRVRFAVAALVILLLLGVAGLLQDRFHRMRLGPQNPGDIVVEQIHRPGELVKALVVEAISQTRTSFGVDKVGISPGPGSGLQATVSLVAVEGAFISKYPREAALRAITTAVLAVRGEAGIGVCRCIVRFDGVAGLMGSVADLTFDLGLVRRTAGNPTAEEIVTLSTKAWISPQLY